MQTTTYDYPPAYFPPAQEVSYIKPARGNREGGLDFLNSGLYKELVKRPSTDVIIERLIKHLTERLTKVGEIFEQKLLAHVDDFKGIDLDMVRKATYFVAQFGLLTNPDRFTVDLTDDASVVLTLRYAGNKDAYLELYFEPGIQEPVQHIVLISENKENIFAYNGDFLQSLSAFMNEMSSNTEHLAF